MRGLPGSGKTTLAAALAKRLGAVHFNADDVRANINQDLGFSVPDRIEQARRMGWMCDTVAGSGTPVVADFVCPTAETVDAFGPAFIVAVERILAGRFDDTNALYDHSIPPEYTVRDDLPPEFHAECIARMLVPSFDPLARTALFVGRYQPFHAGHKRLVEEGIFRVGQACIAVRDTYGDHKNPLKYDDVKQRIETAMLEHRGRFVVIPLPNITSIMYGRDVGYTIDRIDLEDNITTISATAERRKMQI